MKNYRARRDTRMASKSEQDTIKETRQIINSEYTIKETQNNQL